MGISWRGNNLFTYYKDKIIKTALENIITRLCQGGILIVGSHEKLPSEIRELNQYGPLSYIQKAGLINVLKQGFHMIREKHSSGFRR